jgi:mRNA interferase MazF
VRGEVYAIRSTGGAQGHEQSGPRYAVVVQSDRLPLSTWLVSPTSTAARATTFRPQITVAGRPTRVLAEQTKAIDPTRLGQLVGELSFDELRDVDSALRLVLAI